MLVQFGTKCQTVYIYVTLKMLKQSVPYVVLNRYVPGCTSYDTNMYHIMIGICHISSTYLWLCIASENQVLNMLNRLAVGGNEAKGRLTSSQLNTITLNLC